MERANEFAWFVLRDGGPVGPMSPHELAQLSLSRHVSGDDLVWCEGLAEWVRLGRALGVAEQQAAPARTVVEMPGGAPSLLQLYLDRLPTKAGQSVPPSLPARPDVTARRAVPAPAQAATPSQQPAVDRDSVAHPAPVARLSRPHPRSLEPRESAISASPASASFRPAPAPPATLASSAAAIPGVSAASTLREGIAQALVHVLDKHEIRTIDDLANDARLEAVAGAVLDHLPWTLRIVINSTVGKANCERKLIELMSAQRDRWLGEPTRGVDLREFVAHAVGSGRLDEWVSGASARVAGGIGGVASSLVGAVSKGLGAAPDAAALPLTAIGYSHAGGPDTG